MSYSILDAIGNTPLIEIKRLNPNPDVKILAKLEYLNPGGSIKDRIALSMIEAGEKSGELTSEKVVIEATSGNTGIGLALVCAVKGYKLVLAMSEAVSEERQKILKARGAEIILTPGHLGTDGAIEEVYRIGRENPEQYFLVDQFNNSANWKAHYSDTAPEIWQQTKGAVDTVIVTMGTTGTLMGLSKKMKEYRPDIRMIGVEPYLGHKIQGLKNLKEAYQPEIYDYKIFDEKINVEDEDAFEMTRRLAMEEGLFVGMSSGAAMAIALKEASEMKKGVIVVIFPDSGERYLSTPLFDAWKKPEIYLYNTRTRSKELFTPIRPGKVHIYSCGPTVHKRMHIGECRRFVFADILCRYLQYRTYSVNHVINITDLDDKTIEQSDIENMDFYEFTEEYAALFRKDLAALSVKPANSYPRVSDHVDEMVALAEKLERNGFAYEKLRSLYFDVSKLPGYGDMSGMDLDKIKVGATVDFGRYEKDNPRDFTLFKRTKLSELKRGIFVKSKWGNVRPSLHIQCAAISMKYLGKNFDIHTSSRELVFPHHENECAITKALTGEDVVNYWIHCDRVLVDGKKIDENQNRITLTDMERDGYSGRMVRFWMVSAHYRKPLSYSEQRLEEAKRFLNKLDSCIYALYNITEGTPYSKVDGLVDEIKTDFIKAMDDDLNISAALALILKAVKKINILISEKKLDYDDGLKIIEAFKEVDSVLKIFDFDDRLSDPEVKKILDERRKARIEKNWELADEMRDRLSAMGIAIQDKKV